MLKQLIILGTLIPSILFSQYQITGIVKDNKKQPLEFAAVALSTEDNKPVQLIKTTNGGQFTFQKIEGGRYKIVVKILGYKSKEIKTFTLKDNLNLGEITLTQNNATLGEVLVSANKTSKASNIEKKEYSPNQLLNAQNASAAEVIGNIPSLAIGGESNSLSLRGDDNVTVLINGKISSLTGESLSQIPASAIERVEVITNPTAKTNSEGSAGVVNIVLKKAYNQLNSGFIALSAGNNHKYNGQLGYNFSVSKFAFSTAYSFRYEEFYREGLANRTFFNSNSSTAFNQNSIGDQFNTNHFFRLGAEYIINPNQSIILTGSISKKWQNDYETRSNINLGTLKDTINLWDRLFWENDENTLFDATLSYSLKNPENQNSLSIEYSINGNNNNKFSSFENRYDIKDNSIDNSTNFNTIENLQTRITNVLQVDYKMPINKIFELETGLRGSVRDFRFTNLYKDKNPNGELIEVASLTNNFNYEENVYSLYGVISSEWNEKLTSKIGLRLEQTNTKSTNFDTVPIYNYNYFNAFPSAIFNYKLNPKSNLSTSYSMRINRPSPGMLNPLQDVSDPQSQRFGNPELRPELVHSFEVGYGHEVNKKLNFSTSLYHKRSNNSITRFLQLDSLGVARVVIDNIGALNMSGWEWIVSYRPNKWFNLSFNANLSYNTLSYSNNGVLYENDYLNLQTRSVVNVKLPFDMDFQGIVFYKSPFNSPQGRIDYMSNVDLTIRKKILNQKGLLTFGVTDILDDRRFEINVRDDYFTSYFYRKRESRIFTLGFRYNFGSDPSKKTAKLEKQEQRDSGIEGM
jgi:outer membrane receptor protein involved in Fe transport